MEEDFRNPKNKYMKLEDVTLMKIPHLTPIEVSMGIGVKSDTDRGEGTEKRLVYYAGTGSGKDYDKLQYHEKLIDGKPGDNVSGIMLPLIDKIRVL